MREQITIALKEAMKTQDKRSMCTLRLINAALQDRDRAARIEGRDGVSDKEVLDILAKMIKQRREAIQAYEEAGRLELAQQEQEEIDIIERFMPRQLSETQTRKACQRIVHEIGAAGLKDVGRTMGKLKEQYPGQMDFCKASQFVKDLLR